MKKILLSLLLAFVCTQVSHAQDLQLSLNDIIVFEGGAFEPATGKITFQRQKRAVGWAFATPINKDQYPYVKLVFGAKNGVPEVDIVAVKAGSKNEKFGIRIPTDVTTWVLKLEENVDSLYIENVNWNEEGFNENPKDLVLVSATLLAPFATEKVPLPLTKSNIFCEGGWVTDHVVYYEDEKTLAFNESWQWGGWDFDRGVTGFPVTEPYYAIDGDVYVEVVFVFEPLNFHRVQFLGRAWEGGSVYKGIPYGATSVAVALADHMWRLGFTFSNHDGADVPPAAIKFTEVYLLKKLPADVKKTTANAGPVDVYNLLGIKLRSNVEPENALIGLEKGVYIVGGKKVCLIK